MTFDSIYHKMYSKIFFKWIIQQIIFDNKTSKEKVRTKKKRMKNMG